MVDHSLPLLILQLSSFYYLIKITETERKINRAKKYIIHEINRRYILGQPTMVKIHLKMRIVPCSFLLIYEMKMQTKQTHYGVDMDILVCMVATKSSTYFVLLQYTTHFL